MYVHYHLVHPNALASSAARHAAPHGHQPCSAPVIPAPACPSSATGTSLAVVGCCCDTAMWMSAEPGLRLGEPVSGGKLVVDMDRSE
eukprot:CAMPEP_0202911100 /NCGR_PEP_ID=MMETSP1392-20130828/54057_1 /ASSEMBLY_ACC=CAM_ASM_000868 /TAXON_ID=225041 /ORGANISM="Chlamydomonas chlamydogama, Strain SAG 11-48b" /LENGTH=86 /DNA_ID=CAMNT_0049601483 /DNA_START=764 /DNA_END=1024 /DNA_ORIENTATION=+